MFATAGDDRRIAVAVAVLAALGTGVATAWLAQRSGAGATEGIFHATLAATVLALLAPAAMVSRQAAAPIAWCAALVAAAVVQVAITDAPLRSATLGALLALAVAATWLGRDVAASSSPLAAPAGSLFLEAAALAPLCVATQLLARGTVWVERTPGTAGFARLALELVGLPVLAALAAAALAPARGNDAPAGRAFALLAAVVAAGRFHVSLVTTLVVLAVASRVLERERRTSQRLLLALPLLGALVLRPAAGVVALAAALALSRRRGWPAVLLVAAGALLWLEPPRPWSEAALGPLLLVVLLPLGIASMLRPRVGEDTTAEVGGERNALAAPGTAPAGLSPLFVVGASLALALVSLRALDPRAGLVAPVLLIALGLPRSKSNPWRFGQAAWLALLLALGLAAQALPWLRTPGAADLLGVLGWRGLAATAVLATGLLSLSVVGRLATTRGSRSIAAAAAVLVTPALTALLLLPPLRHAAAGSTVLSWPPRDLTSGAPRFVATVRPPAGPARLVLDTNLAHAGALPAGTPVATVTLRPVRARGADRGAPLFEGTLQIGADTGEWAAGAPHLRDAPSPPPHLVAIADAGTFFARRYRAVLPLAGPRWAEATTALAQDGAARLAELPTERPIELLVERAPALPPEVVLTLFGVRVTRSVPADGEAHRR